jgi:hypothetical protein
MSESPHVGGAEIQIKAGELIVSIASRIEHDGAQAGNPHPS